ncbi:MAG TPA: aminopeptidase [Candidatus Dormibacteraeota bacterium]|nr:aminopeptidase [Candidatus Dormibacteraeota bacterium]
MSDASIRADLIPGARNAVRACLNIGPQDRVAMMRDRPRTEIAEAIEHEAKQTGAAIRAWTLEDYIERPATSFPRRLADELLRFRPTASFYVGIGLKGELGFRKPMLDLLADELRCRHGHMIGISDLLMVDGMTTDYEEIYRVTHKIYDIARQARTITVQTALGTDLVGTFSPSLRWVPSDGRYWEQGHWGNLPEGETYTCPQSVDGVIAAEELGDWFADKYGMLSPPVRIVVKAGRMVSVDTPDPSLAAEVREYLTQHPNSSRVGEFAIGTNVGLTRIVGNFLQDEKFPGVHIAFGDPYAFETGADWSCPSHVDALASHATVAVDGRAIMENGRFLV